MIRTCVFNSLHYCTRYFNFVVIRIYKFFIADRDFVHKDMKMKKNEEMKIPSNFVHIVPPFSKRNCTFARKTTF